MGIPSDKGLASEDEFQYPDDEPEEVEEEEVEGDVEDLDLVCPTQFRRFFDIYFFAG